MKNLKSETGRSMVEMLGVLAIIGVLSVGGIAGYKAAMERIKETEAFDIFNKFILMYETEKAVWPDSYFNLESYPLTYDRIKEESNYFCDKYAGKKYCEESKLLYTKATTSSALLFYYFGLYAMTGDTRADSAFTWSLNAQMADDEAGTSCEERPYDTCGKVYLILRLRVSPPTCEQILNALKENPVRQYTAHVGYNSGTWFLRNDQKRDEFNVHDFCNEPSTTAQTNGKLSNFHIQLYLE